MFEHGFNDTLAPRFPILNELCALALSSVVMNLNLPDEVNDFVKGLVAQGRFNSEEDAVVEGIKLLMGREQLRSEVQEGVRQLDSGEYYDEDTVFDEVNAAIDKVEAEQQGS